MDNLSPVTLFVYNRLDHTKKTVKALQINKLAQESVLYIFSDGPKNQEDEKKIKELRLYLKTIIGFKEINIIEREKNIGLANSIIKGVNQIINKYSKIIVLEDDIVTSQNFLVFMNTMLNKYEANKKIYSISGFNLPDKVMKIPKKYNYDIYFNPRASSWGWATWKDRWNKVDWDIKDYLKFIQDKKAQKKFNQGGDDMTNMLIDQMNGKLDSWAIRWCYHHFKNNAFCLYPIKSFVNNIGNDNSGIHCGETNRYAHKELNNKDINNYEFPDDIKKNEDLMINFTNNYKTIWFKKILLKFFRNTFLHTIYLKIKKLEKDQIYKKIKTWYRQFINIFNNCQWVGNTYGGFFINLKNLNQNSIVYSFGIGEGTSFDEELIKLKNNYIYGFDPTPRSINYIKNKNIKNFIFYPYGIGVKTTKELMYLPINKDHISGSIIKNNHLSQNSVLVELKNLSDIMQHLNHHKIDVLKMDIEGLEYEVLEDIMQKNIEIKQILVEFHDRFFLNGKEKRKNIINILKKKKYKIAAISNSLEEYTFIKK